MKENYIFELCPTRKIEYHLEGGKNEILMRIEHAIAPNNWCQLAMSMHVTGDNEKLQYCEM